MGRVLFLILRALGYQLIFPFLAFCVLQRTVDSLADKSHGNGISLAVLHLHSSGKVLSHDTKRWHVLGFGELIHFSGVYRTARTFCGREGKQCHMKDPNNLWRSVQANYFNCLILVSYYQTF